MDKNAIKKYAIWARRELIARVSQRAALYEITVDGYGDIDAVSVHGRILSLSEKNQRRALIAQIQQKGFEQVMEEIAYTWFNRFSALRFMEVNGYLPTRIRVFTDEENNFKPQIMTEAINLEMEGLDIQKVFAFKDANDDDGLFKYLIITQCNALYSVLPGMFQKIADYTELLFPDNLLREGSVVEQMVSMIPEEDWTDQVQIIGWLYQYYNTDLKAKADSDVKAGLKINKNNLAEKTQLFTPDWIVHYMVENSLGRIWLEGHPNEVIKSNWHYYLDEYKQESDVQFQLDNIRSDYAVLRPEKLRIIDPCMGSGHILCVLFDALVLIYEECGYTTQEATVKIVENNLWGLDIDERATQLSYFAIMMKARHYDRRFFTRKVQPHVYDIRETNAIRKACKQVMSDFPLSDRHKDTLNYLIEAFIDAKEYGSILKIEKRDYVGLKKALNNINSCSIGNLNMSLWYTNALSEISRLIEQAIALSQKYHSIVTNPPYLGLRSIGNKTLDYIQANYPNSKNDFFAVFMEQALAMALPIGQVSLVTAESWLSLSSFEKIRVEILNKTTITTMAHLGEGAFDAGFGTVAFSILKKYINSYVGTYFKLNDIAESDWKRKTLLLKKKDYCYFSKQQDFDNVPGMAVSYWVSSKIFNTFTKLPLMNDISEPRQGLTTCDNDRFMRFWHEVSFENIGFGFSSTEMTISAPQKWFPYNKGGEPRKWYGNNDYVVNWQHDGIEIKTFVASKYVSYTRTVKNIPYYFKKGLTWSAIAKKFAVRAYNEGFIFADKGQACFVDDNRYYYICGLLNSSYVDAILAIISPTLDFNCGYIKKIPVAIDESQREVIENLVKTNIKLSKEDWDSFECSWDYKEHPLITSSHVLKKSGIPITIKQALNVWRQITEERFNKLKQNEELINRIFVDIYDVRDELTVEVDEKDITVRKANLHRDIRSFISYAVGCMFGRYSLEQPGLILAGQGFEDKFVYASVPFSGSSFSGVQSVISSKVACYLKRGENDNVRCTFEPDKDGIIPICDDEYFNDDIVGRFVKFVEVVYGKETLEENLKFIADALGGTGTSREIIRNYFINGFYADHLKVYQKRPIYWLFDSGKKNGFKCLVYMHRYQPDTIARIRTDYVHEQQSRYRTAMADLQNRIDNATTTSERVKLTKKLKTVREQDEELRIYEEKIHHLADQMIKIDLDDGVKVNYAKFQDVLAKIK